MLETFRLQIYFYCSHFITELLLRVINIIVIIIYTNILTNCDHLFCYCFSILQDMLMQDLLILSQIKTFKTCVLSI